MVFLHKYTFFTSGGSSTEDTVLLLWAKKKFPSCDGNFFGGAYETRTRDPMRDRHVF
jgi:hypothetical protein